MIVGYLFILRHVFTTSTDDMWKTHNVCSFVQCI